MANNEVKIVISGQDKSKPAFDSASKSSNLLKKDVSDFAKELGVASLALGAAFVGALYACGKAAADAQVQMARVDATLNTMGSSALKNRDAILKAADAAVKLGFDDEDAAESITRLYQRTNDLTKAQELSTLAMDLARAKNIDLASATDLVGQVLSGNARALKAYGIELDETKTPLQALGELHEVVKGQASNFADTFAGKMSVLSIQMNNFKETIGAALLEAIMPFVTQLSEWASRPDVQQKVAEIAKGVGEFAAVVLPVAIETIRLWKVAFDGIVEVLGTIIYQVERAIAAIGRFASAVKNSAVGKAIGGTVSGAIDEIKYLSGARAMGGPVMAGGSYLVGENGPEIFSPSGSGQIIPNGAGMGGITINVSGNTLLDDSAGMRIAEQIMRVLKGNMRV